MDGRQELASRGSVLSRRIFVLISSRQEMRLSIEEPACLLPSKEAESPEMRISIRLTRNNDRTVPRQSKDDRVQT